MATRPFYQTPAEIRDFQRPDNYQKWSDTIKAMLSISLHGNADTPALGTQYHIKNPQFFIEEEVGPQQFVTKKISWNGFPKSLLTQFPDDKEKAYQAAEKINRGFRIQDEYLEWYGHYNSSGKLVRIDFTSEGPEYWEFLHDNEPNTLLALYQKYISPEVQLQDLRDSQGNYDSTNKWNLQKGAMHLNCPPNSLFAEVYLGASATVLRQSHDGSDPEGLCKCARYGVDTRNSDPSIGAQVNLLAAQGLNVSIHNPVGLYIDRVDFQSITWDAEGQKPLQPIENYLKLVRGKEGQGLRYVFEIPPNDPSGKVIGDLFVQNVPLLYPGQIAELFFINLVGIAYSPGGTFTPQKVPCEKSALTLEAAVAHPRSGHAPKAIRSLNIH